MCNLMQLSKCLTRPAQALVRSFSPDALIWISICKINSASVRYTQQFICLRTGLNDYPGFEAGGGAVDNMQLFFFLPFLLLNTRPEALGYRTKCLSSNQACANPREE